MRAGFNKNSGKVHAAMQPGTLRGLRKGVGFSLRDLAAVTGTPYRTVQDYEYGKRGIPATFAATVIHELERDMVIRAELYRDMELRINREWPDGIPSEPESDDE